MKENKILATVNGKNITEYDIEVLLRSLDQQTAMQFYSQDGRNKLLNELISQELFYQEALDNKLEQEEAFKNELDNAKVSILKQYAMRKLLSGIKVEEEEIVNYYNEHKEQFNSPESVRAEHILVPEEDKARDILVEIKEGLSFEEAAKKYSKCPSGANGGDLGYFTKGNMVKEFEDATFSMNVNEISEPVKTQFGYHLIKLIDKKEAGVKSFEEVRNELQHRLLGMKQNKAYLDKTSELKAKYSVVVNS